MKVQKRIRPLMGIKEIFAIPRLLLLLAVLILCGLAIGMLTGTLLIGGEITLAGAFTALIFVLILAGLAGSTISLPLIGLLMLKRIGVDTTARIITADAHAGTRLAPTSATDVTFEFQPQGRSAPMQLTARVVAPDLKLQMGGLAKIRYAKTNPRIVKFDGE